MADITEDTPCSWCSGMINKGRMKIYRELGYCRRYICEDCWNDLQKAPWVMVNVDEAQS